MCYTETESDESRGEKMNPVRSNPDELLKMIHSEEKDKMRGHLKIFFGYAAGFG